MAGQKRPAVGKGPGAGFGFVYSALAPAHAKPIPRLEGFGIAA